MKKLLLIGILFLAGCQPVEPTEVEVDAAVQVYLDEYLDDLVDAGVDAYLSEHIGDYMENTEIDVNIDINDLNDLLVELVANVEDSVVLVGNVNDIENVESTGSAVIYKFEDGYYYAVTNNHVVEESYALRVYFEDYSFLDAELVGTDFDTDIAVIKFQSETPLGVSDFGNSANLVRGQMVVALGSPGGLTYFNSSTFGIISGIDRYVGVQDTDGDGIDDVFTKMLQHDAAINPGNSGGPLFNLKGEIIGINTIKIVSDDIEGMGFSIPNDITLRVVQDLEVYGYVKKAILGVFVGDVRYFDDTPEGIEFGVIISEVSPGGPVDLTSDLEPDDVIVSFGGVTIEGLYHLKDVLFQFYPGDEVEVEYYRDGEYYITTVVLGEK